MAAEDKRSGVSRRKSGFLGNVLRLSTGSVISQVIPIMAAPILTRLYLPEAYGLLGLFLGLSTVLVVISSLSYEFAIMLPERDEDAANIMIGCIGLTAVSSGLVGIVVWLWSQEVASLLGMEALSESLFLLPVSLFFLGSFAALNFWNSRTKHFGRLAAIRVTQTTVTTSMTLASGISGYATGGVMIAANVGGQAVATAILATRILLENGRFIVRAVKWKVLLENLRRYKNFPAFYMWSSFVNTLSMLAPVFLLTFFFSPAVVGFYMLGQRVLQLPMTLVGGAIAQVFFQRSNEARQKGELTDLIDKVFGLLVAIGLFPILMVGLVGRDMFVVVFGPNWAEAGIFAQFTSTWLALFFVSSPTSILSAVLEKQKFIAAVSTTGFVLRSAALIAGGLQGDARVAIALFAAAGVLIHGYRIFAMNKFAGMPYSRTAVILSTGLAPLVPAAAILFVLNHWNVPVHATLTAAAVMVLMYGGYILTKYYPVIVQLRARGGNA